MVAVLIDENNLAESRVRRDLHFTRWSRARIHPVFGFVRRAPGLELVFELVHEAEHRPGAGFAEGADGSALDVLRDVNQAIGVLPAAVPARETTQRLAHPEGALAAGGALATALVRVKLGYVRQRLDDVGRIVHHDDGAGAAHAARLRQRIKVVGQIQQVHLDGCGLAVGSFAFEFEFLARLENFGRGPAGNDGFELAASFQAAAECRIMDQFAERDFADFDLVVARFADVAADADDACAGVVRRAELRVFRGAHRDDVFHRAEGLDVVDDRRAQVETEDGREVRRLDARIGAFAFERFDQAGLLAADVGARPAMDVDLEVVAGPEDVVAV